jgi:prepilin-type N-terminal cleavage/methylation domain-containing protein
VARNEDGFTLIELLVVVMLIAILIAIAVGFQMQARERASDATAKTNLRVATPAFEAYHADNDGSYAGMTLAGLQGTYSPGIVGIEVVSAGENDYCARAVVGGSVWYKPGPSGEITKTACS